MVKINNSLILISSLFIFCYGCQTPSGSNNTQKENPSPKQPNNIARATPIQSPSESAKVPSASSSLSDQISTVVTSSSPPTSPTSSILPDSSSVASSGGSGGGITTTTGNVNMDVNPNPPQGTGSIAVAVNTDKPVQSP